MSNQNRHQAGTVVAGQAAGGQFAAGSKSQADGAALSGPSAEQLMKERQADAWQRLFGIRNVAYRMRLAESEALLEFVALKVREIHPDAAFVHLEQDPEVRERLILSHDQDDPDLGMGLLLDKDGNRLELTEQQRDDLSDIFYDHYLDEYLVGRDGFGKYGNIRRIELEPASADAPNPLIEAIGEETFGDLWNARTAAGEHAGAVRTKSDTVDDLRERLSNEYDIDDVDDEMLDILAADIVKGHQDGWWAESEYQAYSGLVDEEISKFVAQREANA